MAQVIKNLIVDSDDLIFQQFDNNEVIRIADDTLYFFDKNREKISSDVVTDLTINSLTNDINLTTTTDINVPANEYHIC